MPVKKVPLANKKRPSFDRETLMEEARERSKNRAENLVKDREKFVDLIKTQGIRKILRDYPFDVIENQIPSNLNTDVELLIKIPETRQPISFYGLWKTNEKEILEFKKQILLALSFIKKSPVPFFPKVLQLGGLICVGNGDDLPKQSKSENSIAFYSSGDDTIYYKKEKAKRAPYISLIHEYGHKFHTKLIKDGYGNEKIKSLYEQAIQPNVCQLSKMPKIGDPLSDLREDWWTVRMSASDDFILNKIDGDNYIYTKGRLKTILKKQDILKLIKCPSQYGAKNTMEFVAEMITLITLDLVKPSQQLIADKFMEIIEQESI
jgi:hypothetical protein